MKTRNGRRLLAGPISMVLLGLAGSAGAATFAVNENIDTADAVPGDGFCDTGAGRCTLRAAIEEANAFPGADTIDLSGMAGDTILPATAYPAITETVTIAGVSGDPTIIDGGGVLRPFFVNANVTFSDIVIQNGLAAGGNGGDTRFG